MAINQPTVPSAMVSHNGTSWWHRDWDKTLTDGGIYLLGLGGFYVGYQTLYSMALTVGIPDDQAIVLAALADVAILLYSRKAVQEVKEGRSAWGIRLIVAVFSLATFALQLRSAWPNPLATGYHALAPAVWIIGHEMMLRGRLRTAKAARHAQQIAAGLRPAPLPAIRLAWWLLAPFSTFTVWRLGKLWEKPQDYVIRVEAATRKSQKRGIPRAWEGHLLATEPPADPAPVLHTICGSATVFTPEIPARPEPPVDAVLYRQSNGREKVPADELAVFLRALPAAPTWGRPKDKAMAYIRDVDRLAAHYDISVTGVFLAELLQVDQGQVSRLRKAIREEDAKALTAAP